LSPLQHARASRGGLRLLHEGRRAGRRPRAAPFLPLVRRRADESPRPVALARMEPRSGGQLDPGMGSVSRRSRGRDTPGRPGKLTDHENLSGMGFGSAFRFAAEVARRSPRPVPLASPWTNREHLATIANADWFGKSPEGVATRLDAMRVPAIVKGRALIVGTLARQPLAKFRGSELVDPEPWMYRTNTAQAPRTRMLWTLDDLIFYGASLWAVERGARDQILDAIRV